MDPASLLVLVLIAAFVIDRATHAIVYAVSLTKVLGSPGAATSGSEPGTRSTILYFVIASLLSIAFLYYWGPLPILSSLPRPANLSTATTELLDKVFTFIVLVGGGEGISALLDSSLKRPAPVGATSDPIILKGEITVQDGQKS
jgi:hypothetical protein